MRWAGIGGVRESTSWERASSMRRGRAGWRVAIVLKSPFGGQLLLFWCGVGMLMLVLLLVKVIYGVDHSAKIETRWNEEAHIVRCH